jgi:CRISPR-associated protein Csx10
MPHRIVIEARSPLSFAARKPAAQYTPSLAYVPGGVLWGGLGAATRSTPAARFSHARPCRADDLQARVLPVTAHSCKAYRGFRADSDPHTPERPNHGVFDTLIDQVCVDQLQPAALTYDPHCPVCLADRSTGAPRVESISGYYALDQDSQYHTRHAGHRILTRVAIDRRRSTAAPGLLYAPIPLSEVVRYRSTQPPYRYVDEPLRFVGRAWDLDDQAVALVRQITTLGGRTSSGLGAVAITVDEEPATVDRSMADRLQAFHHALRQRWQLIQRLAPQRDPAWSPDEWTVFSVGLQSDALLSDDWLPTVMLSPAQLHAVTGVDLQARLVWAQAGSSTVGGWNVRWNRAKPTAIAATAGSVYVFRTQVDPHTLATALETLEQHGVGLRRAEGYGEVRCCDEWHIQAMGEPV